MLTDGLPWALYTWFRKFESLQSTNNDLETVSKYVEFKLRLKTDSVASIYFLSILKSCIIYTLLISLLYSSKNHHIHYSMHLPCHPYSMLPYLLTYKYHIIKTRSLGKVAAMCIVLPMHTYKYSYLVSNRSALSYELNLTTQLIK